MLNEKDKKLDVEKKIEEKGNKSNRKKIITIILLVAIAVIIVGFGVHTHNRTIWRCRFRSYIPYISCNPRSSHNGNAH